MNSYYCSSREEQCRVRPFQCTQDNQMTYSVIIYNIHNRTKCTQLHPIMHCDRPSTSMSFSDCQNKYFDRNMQNTICIFEMQHNEASCYIMRFITFEMCLFYNLNKHFYKCNMYNLMHSSLIIYSRMSLQVFFYCLVISMFSECYLSNRITQDVSDRQLHIINHIHR